MFEYRRRVVDNELDDLLEGVAAIAIEGPRGVGKTQTAVGRAATTFRLDDPAVRAIVAADPSRITAGTPPILIDEWQEMPETWDLVRRAVDEDRTPGRFLMTGSAALQNPPTHTGAARIVSLRMRSMTLAERGVAVPTVSLSELLHGGRPALAGKTNVAGESYAKEILASGLPGLRGLPERAVRAQLDGYLDRIIDRDFGEAGVRLRNHAALRRWMASYACALSGTTSYEKIRDAATAGNADKPNRESTSRWLDALERLWIIEPIPAWTPARNDLARLAQSPKHQMADPALAARLRGAMVDTLLEGTSAGPLAPRDSTLFGALFEAQAGHDIRVYAEAAEARMKHFRTRDGDHEVDLIVERADQRVIALEVKLTRTVTSDDVKHLRWLQERLGADLLDALVISTGPEAYRRSDGIGVVPLALLGV